MVKYLSRDNLETIAARISQRYYHMVGCSENALIPVNPEVLAESMLGLRIIYVPLCCDGSILGLSTFDDIEIQLQMEDGTTQVQQLTNRDIAIDLALKKNGNPGRCNFTAMHETAHHILFRMFPEDYGPMCHRRSHILYRRMSGAHDWIEWQADTLASSLIMPRQLILQSMSNFGLGQQIEMLNKVFRKKEYDAFAAMAEYLGVSRQALEIRMKQLGLIGRSFLKNPYALVDVWMEDSDGAEYPAS